MVDMSNDLLCDVSSGATKTIPNNICSLFCMANVGIHIELLFFHSKINAQILYIWLEDADFWWFNLMILKRNISFATYFHVWNECATHNYKQHLGHLLAVDRLLADAVEYLHLENDLFWNPWMKTCRDYRWLSVEHLSNTQNRRKCARN